MTLVLYLVLYSIHVSGNWGYLAIALTITSNSAEYSRSHPPANDACSSRSRAHLNFTGMFFCFSIGYEGIRPAIQQMCLGYPDAADESAASTARATNTQIVFRTTRTVISSSHSELVLEELPASSHTEPASRHASTVEEGSISYSKG